MNTYNMRHCTLEKKLGSGTMTTVSWIPEEFAKVGRVVKLKNGDEWSDGWTVKQVPNFSMSSDVVAKIERSHKDHRKVSDI